MANDTQSLFQRRWAVRRLARGQFQRQVMQSVLLSHAVDGGNVGMIQRGQHLRFAFETSEALGVARESLWKDFDGHFAPELGIAGAIHLSHAALADLGENLVVTETSSRVQHSPV